LTERFDVAVIGAGFAGSLMAMIARQLDLSVVLLERGRHPRFAIGESSTPLSNLLLEELAARYSLTGVQPLSKWGSWRCTHPELACGLKRGFSFFHHTPGSASPISRENQLLVAASPHDAIADTHWYRADFDTYLTAEAQRLGAVYLDQIQVQQCIEEDPEARMLVSHNGQALEISARFLVDATGPRGLLHRALQLGGLPVPGMPQTRALYTHFTEVRRLDATGSLALDARPPYPVDDAAVHHIFDGGWIWVLRFSNGRTSAGIAAVPAFAEQIRLAEGAPAWQRVLQIFPHLHQQFQNAKAVEPFRYLPQMTFRSARISGPNWALLPSAAGFVDPLLSTGFPLTLLGIARLAALLERDWNTPRFAVRLTEYAQACDAELLAAARLIGALYANLGNFPAFASISMLYFAAVSYAESARRLGRPELAGSFLLHDHPQFGPGSARVLQCAQTARPGQESDALIEEILRVIEPFDVAGLSNRTRNNWYPVDENDLLQAAHKLGVTRLEARQMLARCGFTVPDAIPHLA
jgi:FADH2 O2-dependent halogenase